MLILNCKECGKEKKTYPSQVKTRKYGVFCNKDCLGRFRTKHLTGSRAANWGEGLRVPHTYVITYAPWHPKSRMGGKIELHRLIAEAAIGRFLKRGESVHHKDHDPMNNHWSNLEVMTQAQHAKVHTKQNKVTGRFE